MERPVWWEWELELTAHLERRMADRDFSEVDLRSMLHAATSYDFDPLPSRFRIHSRLRGQRWLIIVEPDIRVRRIVVVTAYPV